MRSYRYYLFILLPVVLITASCSNTKYLPVDEQLYTGSTIEIQPESTKRKKNIKSELDELIKPKPNGTFLGLRPGLWFHNIAGNNAKKGIRKWVRTKLGEPPVYLSSVDPFLISDLMESRLDNLGYFKSKVDHKVITKKKKASVEYLVTVSNPYKIREIYFPSGSDSLTKAIRSTKESTLIKSGEQYDLTLLKDERARIDNELKNRGYYFFNPGFLVYRADTTVGNREIDIHLDVKTDAPKIALLPYKLQSVYVSPQSSYMSRRLYERDTIFDYGLHFIERYNNIKHKALARNIRLQENKLYSKKEHDQTISRLMAMGLFKFVSIDYNDTVIDGNALLDARIKLTRLLPQTLKVDFDLGSKSNNFSGPAMTIAFTNRNLWKGGELLKLNVNGAYEVQLSGDQKGLNSWEFGSGITLTTPTFLIPFRIRHQSSYHLPKTQFDFQFKTLHRVQYFDMNGFNFSFGYLWRESETKEYQVNPIGINYSKLRNTTVDFDSVLLANPYLRRSFEQQFTFGSTASFTLNTVTGIRERDQYYLNLMLDISGNLLSLINRIGSGNPPTEEKPYRLLGAVFSQYSKISTDFRYYNNFDEVNSLATRIIVGVGVPYGNSTVIPYSKQFFSGGANSVRAFLPRSLGPGSYKTADSISSGFFDQSGDMKIELNAELRFGIVSILKGAVFADAGNVWLMRQNEFLPGGEFNSKKFISELALGTGLGVRLDLSFFLIRLDIAFPLRKPWLAEEDRWVFKDIDFGNKEWRRDNLVYNVAIGYPF